jgi:SAM-dependent methyltransferase
MTLDPDAVKLCCINGYSSDAVSLLLGESYHPGGLALTRRLLDQLGCGPGHHLLDVASGRGTTALLAATEYGAQVAGVDLAPANVSLASGAAAARGLDTQVRFRDGDAEGLPYADATFDLVVCECALCIFPDKPAATRELSRMLKSRGRLGVTDITADPRRLPDELTTVAAWVACIADARPAAEYLDLLSDAGLHVTQVEDHHQAVERMVDQIAARLELLRITSPGRLEELGVDRTQSRTILDAARRAILDGIISYTLIVAEKP